jgi:hypothetical protein
MTLVATMREYRLQIILYIIVRPQTSSVDLPLPTNSKVHPRDNVLSVLHSLLQPLLIQSIYGSVRPNVKSILSQDVNSRLNQREKKKILTSRLYFPFFPDDPTSRYLPVSPMLEG